jgi:hypothetical protein
VVNHSSMYAEVGCTNFVSLYMSCVDLSSIRYCNTTNSDGMVSYIYIIPFLLVVTPIMLLSCTTSNTGRKMQTMCNANEWNLDNAAARMCRLLKKTIVQIGLYAITEKNEGLESIADSRGTMHIRRVKMIRCAVGSGSVAYPLARRH